MKPLHRPGLLRALTAALVLVAAGRRDPQTLLDEANQALARGDLAAAVALYEQASERGTEPGLIAFNQATACYRLALAAGPEQRGLRLAEAEKLFRCSLESGDPRRPRALFGLGNCLLQQDGPLDRAALTRAIDCFQHCAEEAQDDALRGDARNNLELARLRLAQALPPGSNPQDENNRGTDPENKNPQTDRQGSTQPQLGTTGDDKPDPRSSATAARPEAGQAPKPADGPPPPGKGNLPPIPDRADVPPLSPHEAAEHLEQAARRILEEQKAHRLRQQRPASAGVRDW
jgi:hypothetical protein